MIFVDTSGWYAGIVSDDQYYLAARAWMRRNSDRLITTDYVVDELLTLLKARGQPKLALKVGADIFQGRMGRIYYLT